MWENRVLSDRPQMTIQYEAGKILLPSVITKARLQIHTITIFNYYCFSKATTDW
jgi:hypothetical protein